MLAYTLAMAKYLGIDYGTKRVGVAMSDVSGRMAFPRETIANDRALVPRLIDLIRDESVSFVVIGDSKNKDGKDNAVMQEARRFADALENALAVTVYFEPEYYSSVEARRLSEEAGDSSGAPVDAKAAAIILNRYLERSHS